MNQIEDIQQHILDDFGSPQIQERYIRNSERGLRASEKMIVDTYIPVGSQILDIGCGTGRTTIALHKLGYDIQGIDLTPAMITHAKQIAQEKKLDIPYSIQDATKLSYDDNTVANILFLTNGWTQIPGRQKRIQALTEIYRILHPGGIFIFIFHARHEQDTSFFWTNQWIKHNILKNLGVQIKEIDYGDLFFKREIDNNTSDRTQFMHIANKETIKKDIENIGFEILFYDTEDKIVQENIHDRDNVYNYPPMFAVCKKPDKT